MVDRFKYLGILFDSIASYKGMLEQVVAKSTKAMHWLVNHVQKSGWNHPHMRMVLGEVYVRSIMQFGAPTWAVSTIDTSVCNE